MRLSERVAEVQAEWLPAGVAAGDGAKSVTFFAHSADGNVAVELVEERGRQTRIGLAKRAFDVP